MKTKTLKSLKGRERSQILIRCRKRQYYNVSTTA